MKIYKSEPGKLDKKTVVVFTKNNARIFVNPPEISDFDGYQIVINPDLGKVRGTSPHYWKLENGEVVPMNPTERLLRDDDILMNGIDNKVKFKPRIVFEPKEDINVVSFALKGFLVFAAAMLLIVLLATVSLR